jgi:hypothetical protein
MLLLQDELVAAGDAEPIADTTMFYDHLAASAEQVAGIDHQRS